MAIPDTLPSTRDRATADRSAGRTGSTGRAGAGRWRQLGYRLGTFAAGSVVSTIVSQVTLAAVYWLGGTSATTASVVAFIAGAIPNFIVSWRWTWRRQGRPELIRELVPYVMVSIGGLFAATALTTLGDKLVAPLLNGRGEQTVGLAFVYFGSNGLLFLVKFAVLDRVLSNRRSPGARRVPVEAG